MSHPPSPRIAVVDDDFDIRAMLRLVLEQAGHEVLAAQNGQEALSLLRHSPAVGLIILDLKMPVMNGWQFRQAQRVDPALREIPVLILSGDTGVEETAEALGASAYLHKPVDIDTLLSTVEATLTRGPTAAPP